MLLFTEFVKSASQPSSPKEFFESLIESLNIVWRDSTENTLQGVLKLIKNNLDYFMLNIKGHSVMKNRSIVSLKAIAEMYSFSMKRYIVNFSDGEARKQGMMEMGRTLIFNFRKCKHKIFEYSKQIINDDDVILVVGYSSLIEYILIKFHRTNINFKVCDLLAGLDTKDY